MSESARCTVRDYINLQIVIGNDVELRKAEAAIQLLSKFSQPALSVAEVWAMTMEEFLPQITAVVASIQTAIKGQTGELTEKLSKLH